MDISALPPLRDVIQQHELWAQKKLGQNFLLDLNITDKIVRIAGDISQDYLIEVGPGPGGLTRSILKAGPKKLFAIEKDTRCVNALQYIKDVAQDRFDVIEGDALATDFEKLCPAPRRVIANLPYNVATPLLIGWLRQIENFKSLTLMFQKEVAEKIVAPPGSSKYGRLSVICQWLCECSMAYTLPNSAFTPPPKVKSAVVHFVPRESPLAKADFKKLEQVTAAGFGQRRKMIRSSFKSLPGDIDSILDALAIDGTKRAEELSIEDFCAISRKI